MLSCLLKGCPSYSCEQHFFFPLLSFSTTSHSCFSDIVPFSLLTFSPSFSPHINIPSQIPTHTLLPNCLSHVCHGGQSLAFLSSSNTAVHHHDCNSSSACNSRPDITQVIQLPLHHDNGTKVNHQVTCSGTCHTFSHVLRDLWSFRSHFGDWQHISEIAEPAGMLCKGQALVWLWTELDRSWYKYCGIRCFSCDDRFILGNKAFCLFFSCEKLKGNRRGTVLGGVMSYRCRSALGVLSGTGERLKRKGFTGRQSSLTQGEPDSQLSPLKIGFLSPEIRIRLSLLHWGSIRKTCRPLRPQEACSTDLVVISWPLTFYDQPQRWSHTRAAFRRVFVCLPDRHANRRCHLFDVAPPPLRACLRPMTITAQEDKEVSVFTETSRHEHPPLLQCVIYMATLQIPIPYYMYNAGTNNQPLLGFVRARRRHAMWCWYQQQIKQRSL